MRCLYFVRDTGLFGGHLAAFRDDIHGTRRHNLAGDRYSCGRCPPVCAIFSNELGLFSKLRLKAGKNFFIQERRR